MAKITKTEFLNNIQNIINEGMKPQMHDHSKKFQIGHYVAGLFESGQRNPKLMNYLNNYNNLLNSGETKEFLLFEQFGQGLAQYASGNKAVKNVINEMNDTIKNYGTELEAYRLIECIQNPATQELVRDAYDNYLDSEDEESHNNLIDAIDICDQQCDPVAPKLLLVITNDASARIPEIELGTSVSKFDEIQRKIKEDKERKHIDDVKTQVDAYVRQVFDEAQAEKEAEKEACTFESIINNNGINLQESIKNIVSSEARSNKRLMETLEQYAGALNQGLYEERLYESFLTNISKFKYLLPVQKEIKRINEAVDKKPVSIMITKILEEMSTNGSYYIIPLIEEDAVRYVKKPNDVNRAQLVSALSAFASNPYCSAILNAVQFNDPEISATINEKTTAVKDQIKLIREDANVSPIYSPVQYIKENECIFNANGQFYVKKGNTLAKLSDEYLNQLSESFVSLCQLVNDPHVTINKDSITLVGTDKVANIYEGYAEINGNKETKETLRDLNEMYCKYDYDTNFFIMTSCLLENFNNIANVNFGKHIALNMNEGVNVDMFRLGNNIFVNAVNESMFKSTFYHNVNPIQCRNIINNHMGINVASLFEDLLPSQDKLLLKLNETKEEYESSIEKYETTIEKLKAAKEDCSSEENEKKLEAAIESAEKKVEELKKEYKDWQSKAEAATDADKDEKTNDEAKAKKAAKDDQDLEDDPNTDVEKSNEPIDADEVDAVKAELSQPIRSEEIDDEEDQTISDDEFDSYLDKDSENTEVSMMHHALSGDGSENDVPDESDLDEPLKDGFDEVSVDDTYSEEKSPVSDIDDNIIDDEKISDKDTEELNNNDDIEDDSDDLDLDDMSDDDTDDEDESIFDDEDVIKEGVSVPEGYKIANISFDQNLKTGEIFRTGSITVVCPMVSEDGEMYITSNLYHFYVDKESHLPVIEAGDIPVALYNAMVAAIQQEDLYAKVDAEGADRDIEDGDPKAKDVFYKADDVKAASDELEQDDDDALFDFTEDPDGESFTISAKDDESEDKDDSKEINLKDLLGDYDEDEYKEDATSVKKSPVIPAYKDDDTEIELPAATADDTDIPEISTKEAKKVADEDDADFLDDADNNNDFSDFDDEETEIPADDEDDEVDLPDFELDDEESDDNAAPKSKVPSVKVEESLRHQKSKKSKLSLNEARKAFIKLEAEYNKGGKHFFLSEGTIKPSKKEDAHINETLDGIDYNDEAPMNETNDTLDIMHARAEKSAQAANANIKVSNILHEGEIDYFIIAKDQKPLYVIFIIDDKIYYKEYGSFVAQLKNTKFFNADPREYVILDNGDEMDFININDIDAANDLINTIILTLDPKAIDENVKIKRPSIKAKDFEESKQADDILHGDTKKRKFEKDVEKETQKAGIDNPLAPSSQQQQESQVYQKTHSLTEAKVENKDMKLVYEPLDWVIIKETGMKAQVVNVVNDDNGDLTMLTILASNGTAYDVEDLSEIMPDPLYLENVPGRTINSQNLIVPRLGEFDIDPETRMSRPAQNEVLPKDWHKDLNGKTTPVYIVVEGQRISSMPVSALLEDVINSNKTIRVINEDGKSEEYDKDNLEFVDMPYAVVVDSEGKPVRSIQIDPKSYIEAQPEDMVECMVDGKMVEFPKKCIDVLS